MITALQEMQQKQYYLHRWSRRSSWLSRCRRRDTNNWYKCTGYRSWRVRGDRGKVPWDRGARGKRPRGRGPRGKRPRSRGPRGL